MLLCYSGYSYCISVSCFILQHFHFIETGASLPVCSVHFSVECKTACAPILTDQKGDIFAFNRPLFPCKLSTVQRSIFCGELVPRFA